MRVSIFLYLERKNGNCNKVYVVFASSERSSVEAKKEKLERRDPCDKKR
jgi:hypothetical protein